jgi:hypothetical protein
LSFRYMLTKLSSHLVEQARQTLSGVPEDSAAKVDIVLDVTCAVVARPASLAAVAGDIIVR